MKKILFTLLAITTLAVALPAMAQEQEDIASSASLTRIQELKQYVNIEVNNTANGVSVMFTGQTPEYSAKLVDIYNEELVKRGWKFGTFEVIGDMTVTPLDNGFAINLNSTRALGTYIIQKSFNEMIFLAKFTIPLAQFLANHGI
jgi:hypothetical protein